MSRGYHDTRINDVVAAAGLSHGAFYRYFESKEAFAQVLAVQAIRTVSTALVDIPAGTPDGVTGTAGAPALAAALQRHAGRRGGDHPAVGRRAAADATFRTDSAAAFDWGRRRMAHLLRLRGFGDVDSEAVMAVALLSAFGPRAAAATIDAAAHIFERGFLGR